MASGDVAGCCCLSASSVSDLSSSARLLAAFRLINRLRRGGMLNWEFHNIINCAAGTFDGVYSGRPTNGALEKMICTLG